mmetsp:Transcript_55061/g.80831  ORF Transcript_55061/g.80831 Transcript_55061/m.80831 type:complete len:100 (+) Transcript_55061:771-1070(+)
MLAVREGLRRLEMGKVRKLVFLRPAEPFGKDLGFLPGDTKSKIRPYMQPLFNAVDMLTKPGTADYMESQATTHTCKTQNIHANAATVKRTIAEIETPCR